MLHCKMKVLHKIKKKKKRKEWKEVADYICREVPSVGGGRWLPTKQKTNPKLEYFVDGHL